MLQLEAELGVALAALFDGDARALRVLGAVRGEGFRLRDRAAHVYSETDRVLRFRAVAEVRSWEVPLSIVSAAAGLKAVLGD